MSSSHPKPTPCLSDLEIADLIAGRLQGEERVRVLRHLAECEACYEVYAEARALLADEEGHEGGDDDVGNPAAGGVPAPAPPLPFPSRFRLPRWMPAVAAGLLAGIAFAWWLPSSREPAPIASHPRLGSLPLAIGKAGLSPLPLPPDARSESSSAADDLQRDFRLGVGWAHLEAASQNGPASEIQSTARRLRQDLTPIHADPELRRDLDSLLARLEQSGADPAPPPELAPLTLRLGEKMAVLGYEFDLGRFAEFGRLAALAGQAEFFAPGGEAESYLRRAQAHPELTPEDRAALEKIAAAWPAAPGETVGPLPVAAAFSHLILAYQAAR